MDKLEKLELDKQAVETIALEVVKQAVKDWRDLCKMTPEQRYLKRGQFNFAELEEFFTKHGDIYLGGINISAERILKQLQRERKLSEKRAVK